MKYKLTDYGSSNKRQYTFAVGKKDIELLVALVGNAKKSMPQLRATPENAMYHEIRSRIDSMRKEFNKALEEADKLGDDNKRRKLLKPKKKHDQQT